MARVNSDWEKYEQQVRDLLQAKLIEWFPYAPPSSLKVYGKRKLFGAKGSYEIDVSAELVTGHLKILFLVECKYWGAKVNQDIVLSLKSKLDDLGAQKGIIVTRQGFQRGAERIASANGIALWQFNPKRQRSLKALTLITTNAEEFNDIGLYKSFFIKWFCRKRFDSSRWYFIDNNVTWLLRPSMILGNMKRKLISYWPIWTLALIYGYLKEMINEKSDIEPI